MQIEQRLGSFFSMDPARMMGDLHVRNIVLGLTGEKSLTNSSNTRRGIARILVPFLPRRCDPKRRMFIVFVILCRIMRGTSDRSEGIVVGWRLVRGIGGSRTRLGFPLDLDGKTPGGSVRGRSVLDIDIM